VLERRGEGARRLEAAFFRADGEVRRIAVETGAPTREPAMVARLFRERLDALIDPLDPGFGFDLIRLSASRTERCASEAAGFDAGMNEAREIRFLVDRLAARFGAHRVLAFQANDTHIPEAAAAAVPAQYTQATKISWTKIRRSEEAPRRPLRLFAKPEPISFLQDVANQSPLRFRWRRAVPWNGGAIRSRSRRATISVSRTSRAAASGSTATACPAAIRKPRNGCCMECSRELLRRNCGLSCHGPPMRAIRFDSAPSRHA